MRERLDRVVEHVRCKPRKRDDGDDHKWLQQSAQAGLASGYVYRLLRAKARGYGIRWSGLMVLVDLDLLGPTEQRRLVEIEKVRGATMTVLLQDLEARGWVEREAHEADARVTRVMITASGRTELRRAGRLLRDHLNAELSGMPKRVLRNVAASLKPPVFCAHAKGGRRRLALSGAW